MKGVDDLIDSHAAWVEEAWKKKGKTRDIRWTENIAVGSKEFVERIKEKLGALFLSRKVGRKRGADMNSTIRNDSTALRKILFRCARFLDISFGSFFLKAPFCPQKGAFKGSKQPAYRPFCNYIKGLLRSDPKA